MLTNRQSLNGTIMDDRSRNSPLTVHQVSYMFHQAPYQFWCLSLQKLQWSQLWSIQIRGKYGNKEKSIFNLWKDLTIDERWIYVCLQIIMSLIHKPKYSSCWSKNHVINTPIFHRLMRYDRFEQINKMIHFNYSLKGNANCSLTKLNSFITALRSQFRATYDLSQHLAVDEYLSLWKGRLRFRMYITSKREHYGVKIYMICENDSEYLCNFIIYTGSDTKYHVAPVKLPKEFDAYTNPTRVVLSLNGRVLPKRL